MEVITSNNYMADKLLKEQKKKLKRNKKLKDVLKIWQYDKKTKVATKFIALIIGDNTKIIKLEDGYFIEKDLMSDKEIKLLYKVK